MSGDTFGDSVDGASEGACPGGDDGRLANLIREVLSALLEEHHDRVREQLRQAAARQEAALERLHCSHVSRPAANEAVRPPVSPCSSAWKNDAGSEPGSPHSGPRRLPKRASMSPPTTSQVSGSREPSTSSHDSRFTTPNPLERRALNSLATRLSKIEHRFDKDFMARGSLFRPPDTDIVPSVRRAGCEETDVVVQPWSARGAAQCLAGSTAFDICCVGAIVLNAIMVGVEAEISTYQDEPNETVCSIQTGLVTWFVLELLIRALALGKPFVLGPDKRWNLFDTVCVIIGVLDIFVFSAFSSWAASSRVVRVFNIMRIIRTLRLLRVLKYIREFRKMLFAIQGSLQTLLWSLSLLAFTIYAFACCFTAGVANHTRTLTDADPALSELYGSLLRSSYTLYMGMSQGRSWGDLVRPLMGVGNDFLVALFVAFITLTTFGVLNIVTSVFVESAMRTAQHYREMLVQDKQRDYENFIGHLRSVFHQIDYNHSGTIDVREMEEIMENPDLRMYIESLDIATDNTKALFRLLDRDSTGRINIEEFCDGCKRIQGPARNFDIQCVLFEFERVTERWGDFMMFTETKVLTMEAILRHMAMLADPSLDIVQETERCSKPRISVVSKSFQHLPPSEIGPLSGCKDTLACL